MSQDIELEGASHPVPYADHDILMVKEEPMDSETQEVKDTRRPRREGVHGRVPGGAIPHQDEHRPDGIFAWDRHAGTHETLGDRPGDGGSVGGSPSEESEEGDFDDSANALWSLYRREANSFDESTIQTLKDDMDGVLIFAGLFSAALTAFIIDRVQGLQQTPAQQSAFFQQQSVALLNQISQQLSSLGAQVSVPLNVSLSGPTFSPSASDVRVNIYWFMSLVFSLSAALLATLVQRWARDYMHIFKRYSNPCKLARIRQYLHEGLKLWGMSSIAEAVPVLVHISLFLFLVGLSDYLLNTYTYVGKFTLFPTTFCAMFYIISTVAPLMNPKSPFRTPLSSLFWYLFAKLRRRCNNRFGKEPDPLNRNITDGQLQLAMEKNNARKGRDEQAIGWLAENLREDAEMESFALGIPGSFNTEWGRDVWRGAARKTGYGRTDGSSDEPIAGNPNVDSLPVYIPPSPPSRQQPSTPHNLLHQSLDVDELCKRIRHLFETCNNRGPFVDEGAWRQRSRACVETAASFVFCMKADIGLFGEIEHLLSDIGEAEKTRALSETGLNRSFTMRWTCLSLVAIRRMLDTEYLREYARGSIVTLALHKVADDYSLDTDNLAFRNALSIDKESVVAWTCVEKLYQAFERFKDGNGLVAEVMKTLRDYESDLEDIQVCADSIGLVDRSIFILQSEIDKVTHGLIRQLPGVTFDTFAGPTPMEDLFDFLTNPIRPQFLYLQQRLQGLCSLDQGQGIQDAVLKTVEKIRASPQLIVGRPQLMQPQLWRLQDLCTGGAFGFTLELYFLAIRKLLSSSAPSPRAFTTFSVGAFKAITSDWKKYKDSLGTQNIVLNLVCDIAVRDRGIFSNHPYPDYITKELLMLLGNMIEGQANPHIDAVMKELRDVEWNHGDHVFRDSALRTILDHRALSGS